jgi:endo-1,4-beta-mannosidase
MNLPFIIRIFIKKNKLLIQAFSILFIIFAIILFNQVKESHAYNNFSRTKQKNPPTPTALPTPTITPTPTNSSVLMATPTQILSSNATQRVNPVCVSSHIIGSSSQADIDTQTTLMQQAGVKWVRFDFIWGNIEQKRGVYNWSNYDYVVNDINSKGMQVLALVTQWGAPTWELTNPSNYWSPAKNPTDFGTFTKALAAHYKGKISLYEIGNEPNLTEFWPPIPNPGAYTKLLISGYNGVKSVDPTDKVISAGLSVDDVDGGMTFLQNMYNNGAKNHFDYLGFHPYSWPSSPDVGYGWGLSSLDDISSVMAQNGDSSKQIIATEFGWPSTTTSGGVDETTQANYINLMYQNIVYGSYQYVPIACVYDFVDDGTDATNPENNFGVIRSDYSLKPAYSVLQQVEQNYKANFTQINP